MKMRPPKKLSALSLHGFALLTAAAASAQELAPDDPAISGKLGAWFRDAANTFDTTTGIWADSSGNDRHATPVGDVNVNGPVTFLAPTLSTISGGSFSADDLPSVHFSNDVEDLLEVPDINDGTNLTDVTIFVVFNVNPLGTNASLTRPVGIGSVAALQFNAGNNFNLGSDPSIRKDNGQLGSGGYSQAFPLDTTFIRTARMTPTAIDEWFNIDGTPQQVITLPGVSYTTSSDDFFLGDLRAGVSSVPGVVGTGTSRSDFDIVQTIVYNDSLSDEQITGINQWLRNNITGGGGSTATKLEFTAITVSEDRSSATLTWRSKAARTYAIDLSTDLTATWQELDDEVPSDGAETTSVTVPTFAGPQPDPLPQRVFYRVREIQP